MRMSQPELLFPDLLRESKHELQCSEEVSLYSYGGLEGTTLMRLTTHPMTHPWMKPPSV